MGLAQSSCPPLPPPTGTTISVSPSQADELRSIVASAPTGATILLADGYYDLSSGDYSSRLVFSTPDVTLRSLSGNRGEVVLDGGYVTRELISIRSSGVVIADLTLTRALDHPIHASGSPGAPIQDIVIHNVHIIDPGQQAIKVNPIEDGWVDNGRIECSRLELTPAGRQQIRDNCYTGGIDVHKAWGWVVRRNQIEGFWCEAGLSEHAVHFWNASRDTLVEENFLYDNARGVGFGLRESGPGRDYPDDPYPGVGYLGHIDGVVQNNFIGASDPDLLNSQFGFDAGIVMEQARGTLVLHNTISSTSPPYSSIEWRWANTWVEIANNLVTHNLRPRNGAQAELTSNIENADPVWFTDLDSGDLHLTSEAIDAIDSGADLGPNAVTFDFDHQPRDTAPDIGADELGEPSIFTSGFESGGLFDWD